jgi:hypothetical protein
MNNSLEMIVDFFAISLCFLGLCTLFTGLSIQRFIVKRYEKETDLSQSLYFTQLMPFTKYMPDFFSAPLYTGHLLSFVWGWRFVKFIKEKRKKVNYYDDINSPEEITGHFSKKEIRRVKCFAIFGFIVVGHIIAYYIFQTIHPEVFT